MSRVVATAGFGKLAWHGDFIRLGPAMPELGAFDEWQQQGIHRWQSLVGGDFAAQFDGLAPRAFALRLPQGALLGLWCATQDRAGRRYPFVLVQQLAQAGPKMVLEGQAFLRAAAEFLRTQASPKGEDLAGLRAAFEAWVQSLAAAAQDASTASRVDAVSLQAVEYLHRALQPELPPRYVLRLQVPNPLHVSFWLRLAAAWRPDGALPRLSVWNPEGAGRLCMLYDALEDRYFAPCFGPDAEDEHAFDLDGSAMREEDLARAQANWGASMAAAHNLSDLCDRLQAVELR